MSNMLNPGVYQLTQLLLTSPSVVFIHVYHGALQRTERTGRSWDTEPTDSCSESGSSAGESRRQTGAPGGKTQQSLCDADCFTVRRGAQRECFKLLGSKRGFIFTPASTFCSNNEEIMEPWTGQTRAQSLFLKLLGLKSGFIFMLACKPVCSSTMEEPTLLFTGRQAESWHTITDTVLLDWHFWLFEFHVHELLYHQTMLSLLFSP